MPHPHPLFHINSHHSPNIQSLNHSSLPISTPAQDGLPSIANSKVSITLSTLLSFILLAMQNAQLPGFTLDVYEQLSPTWERYQGDPCDPRRTDSVVDDAVAPRAVNIEIGLPGEDDEKPPCSLCTQDSGRHNEHVTTTPPKRPATWPPQLSLPPSSTTDSPSLPTPSRSRRNPRRPKPITSSAAINQNHRNSSTLSLGPSAYVYTPTTARTLGFESLRDDHGIVFKKKRNLVKRVLVALRVAGDGDRVGG